MTFFSHIQTKPKFGGWLFSGSCTRSQLQARLHRSHQPLRGGSAPLPPRSLPLHQLLSVFWGRHDPTTLNRRGGDVGTQYLSGIYYYNKEQAHLARESMEAKQKEFTGNKIVTEILPAKTFYRAEEYHQQYLEKGGGGGGGCKQSASKGCSDPIRCHG